MTTLPKWDEASKLLEPNFSMLDDCLVNVTDDVHREPEVVNFFDIPDDAPVLRSEANNGEADNAKHDSNHLVSSNTTHFVNTWGINLN